MNSGRSLFARLRAPRLWMRLVLGFGALLGLMLVVVGIATAQFRSLAERSDRLAQHNLQRMLAVLNIHQHAQGHGSAMARLLTASRAERELIYPEVDAEYALIEQLLTDLTAQTPDQSSNERLRQVSDRRSNYRKFFIEVGEALEFGEGDRARSIFNQSGQPALQALLHAATDLLTHEQTAMQARQRETQVQIDQSEWQLLSLALCALLLSALIAWRITMSVVRPLKRIEVAANRIAGGDYSVRFKVRAGDELDKVATALNAMSSAVAAREARIEELAFTDSRTGLPNRTRLRRVFDGHSALQLSVILMDVARLRTVNEVLGFDTGDALLAKISQRLRIAVADPADGPTDRLLARLGGGTFAVVCAGLTRSAIEALRLRIDAAMATPFDCDGHDVDVQLIYGLTDCESAEEATNVDAALRCAEMALGQAKQSKLPLAWHVPADDSTRMQQLSLLSELRSAAEQGQLEMWLQPKQCLREGGMLGMEALVRWRHPSRGYISPAEFIPFAERSGQIGIITTAMIDAALRWLAEWRHATPQLSIAVNVSTLDVQRPELVQTIQQLALRHGAPIEQLRLEITESSVMQDADQVLPVLHALRKIGVQLSIDDFGTGYSSLAYLHRLPVTELKIDRSFVADADRKPEAQALLKTIIDLGHSLQMCVTAEGIERPEELALLAALGCDLAQGFLIGRPMAPAAARKFQQSLAASRTHRDSSSSKHVDANPVSDRSPGRAQPQLMAG